MSDIRRPSAIASIRISLVSFLRGLPLLFAARPQTPLRVLCIMAIDAISMLRHSQRLTKSQVKVLATLLDLGACANAAVDNKECNGKDFCAAVQWLKEAGISSAVDEFLERLRELERNRPLPGGDHRQFQRVRMYREGVVRLSLGAVVAMAFGNESIEEGIRATCADKGLEILFRVVMQCQIMDDVLDYSKDLPAGLPSFLTATRSLHQSFELTHRASLGYANQREQLATDDAFSFRLVLVVVSACAELAIRLGRWKHGIFTARQSVRPLGTPQFLEVGESAESRGHVERNLALPGRQR